MKKKFFLTFLVILMNAFVASAFKPLEALTLTQSISDSKEFVSDGLKIQFNDKCNYSAERTDDETTFTSHPMYTPTTGANGEIREPSGDAYDYLYSYFMLDYWGDSYIAGKHVKIYYDTTDNSVYIEKFLDEYMGDCYYIGGTLIEGDLQNGVMEFELRRAVYYSWGEWLMLIAASYDETTGDFYVNENENTFQLNIENGVISNYNSYIALASINDDTDVYWLQSNFCYDPIDMDKAYTTEIPETATMSHYYMTVNETDESIATIYKEGKNFYFHNIFGEGFTFRGVLDSENQIHVDLPQLVKMGDEFIYINTYNVINNSFYKPGDGETVLFDYDPQNGDIYYEGTPITLFSGNKYLYLSYADPYSSIDLVKFTEEEEPIVVPASANQSLYSMSTGYDAQGNHKGGLMKIAKEGNTIYFMRVDNTNYDVVMKGTLDPSTNKVSIPLSQIVGVNGSTFLGLALAKQSIVVIEDYYAGDYNEIRYVVDTNAPSEILIDYDPSTGIYKCNDVLAVINAQRKTVSIALIRPTYIPVNEVATIPNEAYAKEYAFSKDGNVNSTVIVNIARDGNDFYFIHPSPNTQVEEMIIHGVLNSEGKIEIAVPQLISTGKRDQGVFLRVGTGERVYTPDDEDVQTRSWRVFNDDDVNTIYLDFDDGLHEFNYDSYFSFVQLSDNNEIIKAETPYYKPFTLGPAKPAAPTDLELFDKTEDYWGNGERYRIDFVIPCQDVDGNYLPYENMSFRLYFDGEPFVFTPEEYPLTFTEEIIDVPFNHPASSEITHPIWNSNMRQVYLHSLPNEQIGVQSCYTYDTHSKYSNITYISNNINSISSVYKDEPINIQYFDVWGRELKGTVSGLIIIKKIYSDGHVTTEKKLFD